MRFDEIDRNAAAAGRIGQSELEQGVDVARFGIGKAAPDQEFRALLANRPHVSVPSVPLTRDWPADGKEMVNAIQPCRSVTWTEMLSISRVVPIVAAAIRRI